MKTAIVKKLNHDDVLEFRDLIEIFRDVFEVEELIPDDNHLSTLLTKPDFLVFVVKANQRVLGGLTIYVLNSYHAIKPVAYIYDVAVTPQFQGKGFGKLLIAEVCKYCKASGFADVYVETESDDTDAVGFYRKTKCSSEMNVLQFTYDFD